jgi:hypothetical protein
VAVTHTYRRLGYRDPTHREEAALAHRAVGAREPDQHTPRADGRTRTDGLPSALHPRPHSPDSETSAPALDMLQLARDLNLPGGAYLGRGHVGAGVGS